MIKIIIDIIIKILIMKILIMIYKSSKLCWIVINSSLNYKL